MSNNPERDNEHFNRTIWNRAIHYWLNLTIQPLLAIAFVIGLTFLFGYMQRNHNWFSDAPSSSASEAKTESLFACSMLCVFVKAPGRCPVCGMALQEIKPQGDPKDIFGVTIDPTARRLSKIETVAAMNASFGIQTEVMGRVSYDQTRESTISAYFDSRIDDLFFDYTGAKIKKGDDLALLYSPQIYSDQTGLLSAKRAFENRADNPQNKRLYQSARNRLVEFGLTNQQISEIELRATPSNRIKIKSPLSGTIVQKMVNEGDYVKSGAPLFKVVDLTNVWLILEMFPGQTEGLKIGQAIDIRIPTLKGQSFSGTVDFIDPLVDEKTQTVNVRVNVSNEAGLIKIGDLAQASFNSNSNNRDLVIVPRQAVLMNGAKSIAYVETEPGRFEFRLVEVDEIMGDKVSLVSGVKPGEQVVSSGTFMLDSTFNLQGKVSLIDPTRAEQRNVAQLAKEQAEAKEIEEAFSQLSDADRQLAEAQIICPVSNVKLGSMGMGVPIKVNVDGQNIMVCCEGCRQGLLADPKKHFDSIETYLRDNQLPSMEDALRETVPSKADSNLEPAS